MGLYTVSPQNSLLSDSSVSTIKCSQVLILFIMRPHNGNSTLLRFKTIYQMLTDALAYEVIKKAGLCL